MKLPRLLAVLVGGLVVVFLSTIILRYGTVARWFVYAAGAFVLAVFAYLIAASKSREKPGLIIALVLVLETVLFFIFYQQMSTSLNLFALRNVDWNFNVFGFHLWTWKPEQFQSFNPIWIFILSPILAVTYTHFAKRDKDFSIAAKFAMGFFAVAIGFFIYGAAAHFTTSPGKTTSWTMVWGYGFSSLGELLTSGLGLAFVARYVPARMGGFMMGAYFVASGVAQYAGGFVANFASVPDKISSILVKASNTPIVDRVRTQLPGLIGMKLGDFRDWTLGTGKAETIAQQSHVPAYANLTPANQHLVQQFSHQLDLTTMPIYTSLFFWLGVAGVICTVVALALLPLIRKLDKAHAANTGFDELPEAGKGMPTAASEQ